MKIHLFKVEHPMLIKKKESAKFYLIKEAKDKLLSCLDTLKDPIYVNSVFRETSEQIELYKNYIKGGVTAAKPGWSAHEHGRAMDVDSIPDNNKDLNYTRKWPDKKSALGNFSWWGINSEHWHVHYLAYFNDNQSYVKSMIKEVLSTEEAKDKINKLGYNKFKNIEENVRRFQMDYRLDIDGVIGRQVCNQLILMTPEYVFND